MSEPETTLKNNILFSSGNFQKGGYYISNNILIAAQVLFTLKLGRLIFG